MEACNKNEFRYDCCYTREEVGALDGFSLAGQCGTLVKLKVDLN